MIVVIKRAEVYPLNHLETTTCSDNCGNFMRRVLMKPEVFLNENQIQEIHYISLVEV